MTENPNIFLANIKDAVDEISTRVENTILKASQVLDSEVDSLMQEAKETLEINDTLEKLKIYKSKADKILAKSSINKIETFETVLAKNLQLLTDFDQYKGKYELGKFLSAEEGIQRFSNICAIDSVTIFEQISQKIEKLNETLKREKEEEQRRINELLNEILEGNFTELDLLSNYCIMSRIITKRSTVWLEKLSSRNPPTPCIF